MKIEELTTQEVENYLRENKGVLIPLGSMEQHGGHLPLGTDSILADSIVEAVSDALGILKLPVVNFGPCFNSMSHAGTISIATRRLYDLLEALVASLYAQGIRTFYLLSGHAEQSQLVTLRELAEDFKGAHGDASFHVMCTYHINKTVSEAHFDASNEFHACAIETSLMLFLRPDLVRRAEFVEGKKEIPAYEIVSDKKPYWRSGVYGDPRTASEELGKRIFEGTVRHIVDYIQAAHRSSV